MRRLFCPICASYIEERHKEFSCAAGAYFPPRIARWIRNAVYAVDAPKNEPRMPAMATYLWCPSCTAELHEYDPKQLHLRCSSCSLELRAVAHQDLMRIRKTHEEPDPEYRGPDDDADSDYL